MAVLDAQHNFMPTKYFVISLSPVDQKLWRLFVKNYDGFTSKPRISFSSETDFIAALDIDIAIPHNVSKKTYTNRRIRNL